VKGDLLEDSKETGADGRLVPIIEQTRVKESDKPNSVKVRGDIVLVGIDHHGQALGKCLSQRFQGLHVRLVSSGYDGDHLPFGLETHGPGANPVH